MVAAVQAPRMEVDTGVRRRPAPGAVKCVHHAMVLHEPHHLHLVAEVAVRTQREQDALLSRRSLRVKCCLAVTSIVRLINLAITILTLRQTITLLHHYNSTTAR